MHNLKRAFVVLTVFFSSCLHQTAPTEQDAYVSIDEIKINATSETAKPEQIFKKTYESYTLFLFTKPNWFNNSTPFKIKALYDEFKFFGDSIGENNLAIWFSKKGQPDFVIGGDAAYWLSLDPNSGPYIVYFKPKRPTDVDIVKQITGCVIAKKLSRQQIAEILNDKSAQFLAIDTGKLNLDSTRDLLNILRISMRTTGEIEKTEINTAVFKEESLIVLARGYEKSENFITKILKNLNINFNFTIMI